MGVSDDDLAAAAQRSRRALVVFYSRNGHTRALAFQIAEQIGADVEEIVDRGDRGGLIGYLRSLASAVLRRPVPIRPSQRTPRDYAVVVIGTPVWAWQPASPVRSYLRQHRGRFRQVAFFCCHRGFGAASTFNALSRQCGRVPMTTLALSARDMARRQHAVQLARFVRDLRTSRRAATADGLRRVA